MISAAAAALFVVSSLRGVVLPPSPLLLHVVSELASAAKPAAGGLRVPPLVFPRLAGGFL
jgi:hypothetical protein